jgi:hypothetical protein
VRQQQIVIFERRWELVPQASEDVSCHCCTYRAFAGLDKSSSEDYYISLKGHLLYLAAMSSRSTRSTASQSSTSSSATAASLASHQSSHPYLTPGRASTISTWQLSLPERQAQPHMSSDAEAESRKAAVEAYQQLKLSLFSRAKTPTPSRPS